MQGWYVGECLVIALLLLDGIKDRDAASLLVVGFGMFVQLLAVGCSYWGEAGACDAPTGLPLVGVSVLVGVGIVAEVIAYRGRHVSKRG